MGRWQPDAAGRLQLAAMELYLSRGYDQTTVAEIAEHAGLTERTFFRHFGDKREVLFAGSELLQEVMVSAMDGAPSSSGPMDAVGEALSAAAGVLQERREFAGRRNTIIMANPELQERELMKMANLSAALAGGLRRRGVKEPAASLAAEAGIGIFRVAFERWVTSSGRRPFRRFIQESRDELQAVAGPRTSR